MDPLALMLSTALAATAQAPQIPVEHYQLDNGMQVLLSEDVRLPVVAVEIRYRRPGTDAWSVAGRSDAIDTASGADAEDEIVFKDGKVVWDTTQTAEGAYEVRAVATDRAANFPEEGK